MEREEIYRRIKAIILDTFKNDIDMESITEGSDLQDAFGINSLAGIEILVRVEAEFDIEIDDEDLSVELTRTMSTLANYIESKLNK